MPKTDTLARASARRQTILTLVRHGETRANIERVWHGSTDTPLTARGLAQAERVASYLADTRSNASVLYSSPLKRALGTARLIAESLDLTLRVDPDLSEYDLGSWEGKSFAELQERHRFFDRLAEEPDFAPEGAESPRQVSARIAGALRRIAAAHPEERVVVVSHGGAMTLGLNLLAGHSLRRAMSNCAVSDLVLEPNPQLLSFNETDHLRDL